MRKRPSPWSIVWTDNFCFRVVTLSPFLFLFALMVKLTGQFPGGRNKPPVPVSPESANLFLGCATGLVFLLVAILLLRVTRTLRLFESGQQVEATVQKVRRFKGGTTLKLEFRRAGITYRVRSTFQRWRGTPSFDEGTCIPLLVDPLHPKRAVPLALYADARAGSDG